MESRNIHDVKTDGTLSWIVMYLRGRINPAAGHRCPGRKLRLAAVAASGRSGPAVIERSYST